MPSSSVSTLRIIGGQWRSRRVEIATADGLRPTPDRVRETLFNWLAPRIEGARCLDLFAGTGALGLEALSRGAAHVTFIECEAAGVRALQHALATLGCANGDVIHADALKRVRELQTSYDVIFIDPPFAADLHVQAMVAVRPLLSTNARVYLEYPATQADATNTALAQDWRFLRRKHAGRVGYSLVCKA